VTATAINSSLNPSTVGTPVTFTATVSSPAAGTITGSVIFKDGTTTLGTGTVSSGKATFATSALTEGSHAIAAVYGGDANFTTSSSAPLSQTVNAAPDFSVAAVPAALTLKAGQSGMLMLNVTPINGATFTVNFTSGSLPSHATCVFSPASVTLDGTKVASSSVTISTLANSTALPFPETPAKPELLFVGFAAVLAVLLAAAERTSSLLGRRALLASAILLIGIGLNACATSGAKNGTPPGTYPVMLTVASTAGGISHTVSASVKVTE
jgi:hypothetical protein